ncbi:MOSC domain-containing protein [Ruegeria pomeroyi]|nr:MOSC domain-containing protein [Ruegeria pomeroyi]NVK96777.1 MOSC domain-containing protein [Ruegeria pomeroyi]NVK99994.1 MOSC domain-containing protein [Ruegeria pomeroyi]HCE71373.1 MOSC domain-containing protein [Ruegeria sp.]
MTEPTLNARIDGIFLGSVAERWPGRPPSAIGKTAVGGCREINEFGFIGDAQADLDHHGGHDKAIHHYPSDHYPSWIAEGQIPAEAVPAAFGENIVSVGITETNICIGDRLRLGTAIVEVSQGRQPCWKVSEHTGNAKMAYLFQKTGRTGWYYRVLEPGQVSPGDQISLIERHHPEWTVETVTRARLTRRITSKDAAALAELVVLAEGWRSAFARMAAGETHEDTDARLIG